MPSRDDAASSGDPDFLTGGGELGARIRSNDWAATPFGNPETWPQALRSAVQICLNTPIVAAVHWGPELRIVYNDAYAPALAERHPWALGQPFREVWSEIWDVLGPQIDSVIETGRGFSTDHQPLKMIRNGRLEDTYWIYSFAPLHDDGAVAGVFVTALETTDKVVAERRLMEEQERQRQMLRQMPGFVGMLSGPDLVYTYVNDAYVAISERGDFVGRRFRDVFADIVGQGFHELFENVFHTGKGVVMRGMELRLHGRDDTQHVDFVLEPIRDDDGIVTGVFVGGYETTEIYRGNAALRESEARFRLMADAVPQIVWITDRHGRMEFLNKQFVNYTGAAGEAWAPAEMAANFIHPEDGARVVANFEAALGTGEPFEIEHRIRSAASEDRWFLARAEPYRDPDTREITRWFGASVDIHDRKLADERLRELNATLEERVAERTAERNMLATLVETTDIMIMAADFEYNILATNAANADEFERIYGVRPKAGDNMLELLAGQPEHQEQVRAGWARGLRGEHVTFVENFGDPDRVRPYYEIKFRPLRNEAGEQIGAYQFVTDVTDRLRKEAQLAEAQEALRQSQKLESMGQLTGGVAHDFNNLLTPIIGSLDMLVRKGIGNERERRLVDGALQSAERAKTLVQRLLAFARRQPLQPTAVDLHAVVETMAGLIGSTLGPTIDVKVQLAPDLPPALADPNQLEMALLNLAVNARDAMPDGGVLTIEANRQSVRPGSLGSLRQGHYVLLCVSDTGVGMDEATRTRAIEPFFSTKGVGRGTGLGLSMVHGLAAQLGGELAIDSAPGRGTTIKLWLPMSIVPAAETEVATAAPKARADRGIALLVDDEELVRMSTADMLIDLGFEVIEAGSAEDALRLLKTGTMPNLLITDHLMPGMKGAELAREARELKSTLPVLIVSGYAEVEGLAPDLPRLTKPFRNAELATSIAALLQDGGD